MQRGSLLRESRHRERDRLRQPGTEVVLLPSVAWTECQALGVLTHLFSTTNRINTPIDATNTYVYILTPVGASNGGGPVAALAQSQRRRYRPSHLLTRLQNPYKDVDRLSRKIRLLKGLR